LAFFFAFFSHSFWDWDFGIGIGIENRIEIGDRLSRDLDLEFVRCPSLVVLDAHLVSQIVSARPEVHSFHQSEGTKGLSLIFYLNRLSFARSYVFLSSRW
jgi:hypothetical protein